MPILNSSCWRIRADGDNTNGGGYDSTISGAGTDYTDQAAAQLTLTDLATSGAGVSVVTSATGGFTSAMVGNCIKITSGTNFQTGYYFVTVYTDTNTVTVDRSPTSGGAGSSGNGKLGGAWGGGSNLDFQNLATAAGSKSAPAVTTPLAAGHTVYIRGSGGEDPGSADYTQTGYYTTSKAGDATNGKIRFVGYNGRPRIDIEWGMTYGLTVYTCENLHIKYTGSSDPGICWTDSVGDYVNVWVDQAGYDRAGMLISSAIGCRLYNTGGTTQGTAVRAAINLGTSSYGSPIVGCTIKDWRGAGIYTTTTVAAIDCIISSVKRSGIHVTGGGSIYVGSVMNCTIYNSTEAGIYLAAAASMTGMVIANNVITNNATFGIDCAVGTTALNDKRLGPKMRNNFYYLNTSGHRNNLSLETGGVELSAGPFTTAGSDFSLNNTAGGGAAVRAVAFPTTFPGSLATNYRDGGAVQHQDAGGGGGGGPLVGGRLVL